jgi:cold shock CspA family protein
VNAGSAKRLGEHTGKVVRWGAGGFGFIQCADLTKDVYFKASSVSSGDPSVGDEVELVVLEYPGDKLVARDVRVVGGAARAAPPSRPRVGAPLAGRIRGLEALVGASKPAEVRVTEKPSVTAAVPSRPPDTLGVAVHGAEERERAQAAEVRASAEQADDRARAASSTMETTRTESERRRRQLERELAELEIETRRQVEELQRSEARHVADAEAARSRAEHLEQGVDQAVAQAAASYLQTARDRFQAEMGQRERTLVDLARERQKATDTVGVEPVTKYEETRRRAIEAQDPDQREAFGLLERRRRQPVERYAEALDAWEASRAIDAPFWLVGDSLEPGSAVVVAPYEPSGVEGAASVWRLHCAFLESTHRLLHEMGGNRETLMGIERASVAGCFALRLRTLDTDLLPLVLEDALAARPALLRLGLKLRFEEQRQISLPLEVTTVVVESLESPATPLERATGGPTRDAARRLGLDLDDLVETLVTNGLPFEDDTLAPEVEETVRALLGLLGPGDPGPAEPVPPAPPEEAPALDPVLNVAGRMLAKLLRAHVIGGKHTRIENAYGHHFADSEKALAREVADTLMRLGILMEKQNMGSRHVSIDPRMLGVARDLASERCTERAIIEGLLAVAR